MQSSFNRMSARVAAAALSLVAVPGISMAQVTCQATRENPVVVCFDPAPLTVDHCGGALDPHFSIDVFQPADTAPVAYRYTSQILVDGAASGNQIPVGAPDNPSAFALLGKTDGKFPSPPPQFAGSATYAVRINVYLEGSPNVFTATSPGAQLQDRPIVRGLAIGISHYNDRELDLNYADADAAMFQTALEKLLKPYASVEIELRTSEQGDSDQKLSRDDIRQTLEAVSSGASQLCGPNDWYVFYFSGHGVVGVNKQRRVGRYLSTKALNPKRLPETTLSLSEVLLRLKETGATNILVVLDSCFSGSYLKGSGLLGPGGRGVRQLAMPISGKVKFVYDNEFQPLGPSTSQDQDQDRAALKKSADDLNEIERHAWLLAAAGGSEEAEEGPVQYQRGADGTLKLAFERASTRENSNKPGGHGLYTYTLLASLQANLPAGADALVPDGPPAAAQPGDCRIDFDAVGSKARVEIYKLAQDKRWTLQTPEIHETLRLPNPITCGISPLERQ